MSEDNPEEDGRINHASGIIAAGKGKIKITQAMKLVGFTTPERKNITLYQKVRRGSHKMQVVPIAPRTIKKSSLFEVESALSTFSSAEESAMANSSSNRASTTTLETHAEVVTPRRLPINGTPVVDNSPAGTAGTGVGSGSSSSGMKRGIDSVTTTTTSKKRRKSSKQVQHNQATTRRQEEKEKKAMKLATVRIKNNNQCPKGHKNKISILKIVNDVNALCESNISHKTAAACVRKGLVNVSPLKRGPVGDFPKPILDALT